MRDLAFRHLACISLRHILLHNLTALINLILPVNQANTVSFRTTRDSRGWPTVVFFKTPPDVEVLLQRPY